MSSLNAVRMPNKTNGSESYWGPDRLSVTLSTVDGNARRDHWRWGGMLLYGYTLSLAVSSAPSRVLIQTAVHVRCDSGWCTESCYPTIHEGFSNRLCSNVGQRKSFWPTCEPVDTCKQVSVTLGRWEWPNEVKVYHIKTGVWCREC